MFDDDGTYVDGVKAKELYETKKEKYIIENFVHDQSQKHFLVHSDGYKC